MTELIWDGKYDAPGNKTAPLRVPLPFQTVETVNESAQEREKTRDLFAAGRDPVWRNRLIWGDKKYVLPSLLDEFAGKVNLIYIDPPFNVGADFSFTATIPDNPDTEEDETTAFTKEPSVIEMKAYRDTWGRGLDSYLQWFYETVVLLRELLAENGSIYVHLDWHVGHYAKAILDEVFGYDNIKSQIIWQRVTGHMDTQSFGFNYDMILFYGKAGKVIWNRQFAPYDESYLSTHYQSRDPDGRRFELDQISAAGAGSARYFFGKLLEPPAGTHWRWSQENIDQLCKDGRIVITSGGRPRYKRYLDEQSGKAVQSIWPDIPPVNSQAKEDTNYSTQKPEALLERIIKASSNEGDLVLDCFCGSGTTAAVAEKLNRRWIACDLGRFAIHTARKRLLCIPDVRPFVVQNLGKYERQAWQKDEFGGMKDEGGKSEAPNRNYQLQRAYTDFILKLYGARPVSGYTWLHGLKGGRMVHVGAVDAPIALGDITQIVAEFKKAVGTGGDAPSRNGVDALGWDFAFELNEVAKQHAAQANLDLKFMRIPNDVMDKRAVEQGDIRFFELAALEVDVKKKGRGVTLTLSDFVIPPDDVPEEVQRAVKHWSQWIDYWAVDWDYRDDTFHNQWQAYRTRQDKELQKSVAHTYNKPGQYTVVVKVIDILGNDTTKSLKVEVK
jgi:DNA modification methylase